MMNDDNTMVNRPTDEQAKFLFEKFPNRTLREWGAEWGLSHERVRQIKEKAIRRLKHTSRSKILKTYLG